MGNSSSWPARTLVIPFKGETHKVIVLRQKSTGNLITAASGVVSSAVTWDNAEITGVAHAQSNDWTFAIPAIPKTTGVCFFTFYDVAATSVAKTTTPTSTNPILYDPESGETFTDSVPLLGAKLRVRQD